MQANQRLLLLLVTLLTAGCAAERPQAPAPTPAPIRPAPPPPPPPAPTTPSLGWQDMPLTSGSWSYEGEQRLQATFGASAASLIIRCDLQSRQVQLLRPGVTTGNVMRVQTSEMQRTLPISITPDASATPYGSLNVDDPLLDGIAFSRGRFSVEVPGLPMLVIPAWPEPARVIEDCRR